MKPHTESFNRLCLPGKGHHHHPKEEPANNWDYRQTIQRGPREQFAFNILFPHVAGATAGKSAILFTQLQYTQIYLQRAAVPLASGQVGAAAATPV